MRGCTFMVFLSFRLLSGQSRLGGLAPVLCLMVSPLAFAGEGIKEFELTKPIEFEGDVLGTAELSVRMKGQWEDRGITFWRTPENATIFLNLNVFTNVRSVCLTHINLSFVDSDGFTILEHRLGSIHKSERMNIVAGESNSHASKFEVPYSAWQGLSGLRVSWRVFSYNSLRCYQSAYRGF